MGICSSCLGRSRRDEYEEVILYQDEERLLFEDANAIAGFGSFTPQYQTQYDSETHGEMESLQRVVAKTAGNMVDIFEIASCQNSMTPAHAPPTAPFVYASQGARDACYQHLAALLLVGDDVNAAANLAATGPTAAMDWITDDEDEYDYEVIKMTGTGTKKHTLKLPNKPLVGTFATPPPPRAAVAKSPTGGLP